MTDLPTIRQQRVLVALLDLGDVTSSATTIARRCGFQHGDVWKRGSDARKGAGGGPLPIASMITASLRSLTARGLVRQFEGADASTYRLTADGVIAATAILERVGGDHNTVLSTLEGAEFAPKVSERELRFLRAVEASPQPLTIEEIEASDEQVDLSSAIAAVNQKIVFQTVDAPKIPSTVHEISGLTIKPTREQRAWVAARTTVRYELTDRGRAVLRHHER